MRGVERQQGGRRGDQQPSVVRMLDHIAELDPPGRDVPDPAADPDRIVEAGRLPVADGHLAHGEPEAGGLELAIARPALPQVLGAGDVEPDQIPGVVDDAHLVGLGVVHPDQGLGDGRSRHAGLSGLVTLGGATRDTESRLPRGRSGPSLAPCWAIRSSSCPTPISAWRRPPSRRRCWRFSRRCPTWAIACSSTATSSTSGSPTRRVIPRRGFHVAAALARLRAAGADRDGRRQPRPLGRRLLGAGPRASGSSPHRLDVRASADRRVAAIHGDGLTEPRLARHAAPPAHQPSDHRRGLPRHPPRDRAPAGGLR